MRQRMRWRIATELVALAWLLGLIGAPVAEAQGPIKAGFVTPLTGVYAAPGTDMRDGFLLYWSQVGNKAAGRTVEVIVEDKGSNKPEDGLTKARKLVERDEIGRASCRERV